jgi:hypothetical protein
MSHPEQRMFMEHVAQRFPDAFVDATVLEVGSRDINGTCRDLFRRCDYTGIDLTPGPCVDAVVHGSIISGLYDTVYSCEALEHDALWMPTFVNMWRVAHRLVVFTTATTGREEHGTHENHPDASPATGDYYGNLTPGDFAVLPLHLMFEDYEFTINGASHDLYFWGIPKHPSMEA